MTAEHDPRVAVAIGRAMIEAVVGADRILAEAETRARAISAAADKEVRGLVQAAAAESAHLISDAKREAAVILTGASSMAGREHTTPTRVPPLTMRLRKRSGRADLGRSRQAS